MAETQRSNAGLRWLAYIGLFIVGFFAYWLSDLFLDRYIGFGMSWVIVGIMCVIAFVIWVVDERRMARAPQESTTEHDEHLGSR